MERNRLQFFTEQEKIFAEKNHNLIYAFLHTYKYSVSEYYNIVVFGFLKAVQAYHRNEDKHNKYDFQYFAWQHMKSEIGNYLKMENAKKRKPEYGTVSLDAEYSETEALHNCIGGNSAEDEAMEKELLNLILDNLSDTQRKIVCMKVDGYSNKEMIVFLEIPSSTFYKEMERIKSVVEKVLND